MEERGKCLPMGVGPGAKLLSHLVILPESWTIAPLLFGYFLGIFAQVWQRFDKGRQKSGKRPQKQRAKKRQGQACQETLMEGLGF